MLQNRSFVLCRPFSDTLNVSIPTLFSVQYTQIETVFYTVLILFTQMFFGLAECYSW